MRLGDVEVGKLVAVTIQVTEDGGFITLDGQPVIPDADGRMTLNSDTEVEQVVVPREVQS